MAMIDPKQFEDASLRMPTPGEIAEKQAAAAVQEAKEREAKIMVKDSSTVPTIAPGKIVEVPSVSFDDFKNFQEEMKQQMAIQIAASAAQVQSLQEQNVALQTDLKRAQLAQPQPYFVAPGSLQAARLPEGLKVGDEVSYFNHAGGVEHAVIIGISEKKGVVSLQVHGRHENDVYKVHDVKFGDRMTRNSFTLDEPPAVPKKSPDRAHSKGLSVGNLS